MVYIDTQEMEKRKHGYKMIPMQCYTLKSGIQICAFKHEDNRQSAGDGVTSGWRFWKNVMFFCTF